MTPRSEGQPASRLPGSEVAGSRGREGQGTSHTSCLFAEIFDLQPQGCRASSLEPGGPGGGGGMSFLRKPCPVGGVTGWTELGAGPLCAGLDSRSAGTQPAGGKYVR